MSPEKGEERRRRFRESPGIFGGSRAELRAVRVAVDFVMPRQSLELEVRRSGFTFGE